MPAKRTWTDAQDTRLRQMRAAGATWDVIAAVFWIAPATARDRGYRLGVPAPVPVLPSWQPPGDRPALAAGHPVTWGLLTAGTCLEGAPYG